MTPNSSVGASATNAPTDSSLDDSPHGSSTGLSSTGDVTPPELTEGLFRDPSVVVGMACRVPGATNTRELWENLSKKKDLRGKIPADRFNVDAFYHPQGTNKGTTNARYGYFIDQDLSLFDNEFFRISGKEAESMDPQQRLLLEVVYEALENAGISLDQISGSRTSVYVGSFSNDYHDMSNRDTMQYPKYLVTGTGNALLSNRISYFYDLHGPSITIDTACSSSLICLHLGNQSLQMQESDICIVAGSALHFDPSIFVSMTDLGMLATDGVSRAFDAAGSGYARGEGVCAVILKRQRQAEADGDVIRAIIRGTSSNHDGLKEGITLPNGKAQEALMLQTYKEAGLSTADTHYFEAHGTGTKAGDPREANAIGAVFSVDREEPLIVGSIKSHIGHLEGASGLAGFIKATMTVEKGKILPNMHFNTPNPEIDLAALKIRIPVEVEDWKATNGPRRASVNSFGYGGANAHAILENYVPKRLLIPQKPEPIAAVEGRPFLIPLTSHTEKAGLLWAKKLSEYLPRNGDTSIPDLAHTLSSRRSMHKSRSFAVASNREGLLACLETPSPLARWTRALDHPPRIGFVFTGQGAQWHAMGRQLIEQSTLFRETLQRCDEILARLPDQPAWSVLTELLKSDVDSNVGKSLYSQPLCAAIQLGITALFQAWGITPSAVVGHSSGEIAAAAAAGILTFEDAIICAYYRGLYMSKGIDTKDLGTGAMMAVGMTKDEALAELKPYEGRVALAAINSPSSLTFSGDEDAILEIKENLEQRKIFARLLKVEQAFHSHHMDPLAPAFEAALSQALSCQKRTSSCLLVSSVTGRKSHTRKMNASYWAANMTGVVRFSDALTGILLGDNDQQNLDILVEIGPHPALKGPSSQTMKAMSLNIPYIASLTRDTPAFESLLACAGQLFSLGYPVNVNSANGDIGPESTSGIFPASNTLLQNLPSYAWDQRSFWAETRLIKDFRTRANRHSLLGARIPATVPTCPQWRNYLRTSEIPWLSQHVIDGKAIFPAAGFISMAIEAIVSINAEVSEIGLRDVMFKQPLNIPDTELGTEVLFNLQPLPISAKSVSNKWYRFIVTSFDENSRPIEHCHGHVGTENGEAAYLRSTSEDTDHAQLQARTTRRRDHSNFYEKLNKLGLGYGEKFRLLSGDIESGPGFALGTVEFDPAQIKISDADLCVLHPTVLDASFHTMFASIETQMAIPMDEAFVPTFIRYMEVSGKLLAIKSAEEPLKLRVITNSKLPGARVAINKVQLMLADSEDILINIDGFEVTAIGNESAAAESQRHLFFQVKWKPAFDQLGNNTTNLSIGSISELMDLYAHQFPNAKILHSTASLESTQNVLRSLGGLEDVSRRFSSITPLAATPLRDEIVNSLKACYPAGLINLDHLEDDSLFDIIVVSAASPDRPLFKHLKPDAFIILDNQSLEDSGPFIAGGMLKVFADDNFTIWRNSTGYMNTKNEDLTIVVSDRISEKTQKICTLIQGMYKGYTKLVEFQEVLTYSGNIVSLVSLDDELFFNRASDASSKFKAAQTLFTTSGKNIVWLLQGASHESSNPAQALVQGLIRTIRNENEDLRLVTLDLAEGFDESDAAERILEVLDPLFADEDVAVRRGILSIPRLETDSFLNRKLPYEANRRPRLERFRQDRPLALKIGTVGLLDSLHFGDDDDMISSDLADDELEIEVRASALNFRDIAASMGIIDDYRLGDECSGIVVRAGSKVDPTEFKPGDQVLACRPGQGAHRSLVRNPAMLCQKFGDEMDFITAASFQGVLTTAYYSLIDIARLKAGEYCLIHSAAGGVGQMAIQLTQMLGAIPIATVGSQAKRQFLKEKFGLTDDMMFSSRDPSFVEGVLRVTKGRGCDVALNSLAGDLLHATWKCIAPFGRLIEIGKRDIHENTKLDMEPFRRNIAYASVDIITLYYLDKPLVARLMRDGYNLIASGRILPPGPFQVISYAEAQKGFRLLQMGKYFGKVVLVPGENDLVPVVPSSYRNSSILFDPAKSYLLVGGLGGIGRALAEWMFLRGARNLVFLSRSGADKPDAKATIDWLVSRHVKVSVLKGDVTVLADVETCINSAGDTLAGIFFAAMILRDTPFAQMTHSQWTDCVEPKVRGAHNLHTMTKNSNLDFFISFSSGNAVVGSMAQANYAAANSYLDALMRHRREIGLAGTTMNVGMVSGVGVVAHDLALEAVMTRLGYEPISEAELFYQIEEALAQPAGRVSNHPSVEHFDYHRIAVGINMQRKDLYWARRAMFRNLYANLDLGAQAAAAGTFNLTAALQSAAGAEEKSEILLKAFIEKVASVLAVPENAILPVNPLSAYGLDSIVALEFRKWFSQTLSVDVPLFEILGAKSITALLAKVTESLATSHSSRPNASHIDTTRASNGSSKALSIDTGTSDKLVLIERVNRPAHIPISSYQSRFWFLHNILEQPSDLNFTVTCYATGEPDKKLVIRALTELVQRNDILRTRYFEGEDFTEQHVLEDFPALRLHETDLSGEVDAQKVFNDVVLEKLRSQQLNIESGEGMRMALVKLAKSRYAMVFIFNHIVLDNGSTRSSMEQFTGLYNALATGNSMATVPAPNISYSDFTLWHSQQLRLPSSQDHLDWWTEKLSGAPLASQLLPFAIVSVRPSTQSRLRDVLRQVLPAAKMKRMKRISSELKATPFQFLLSCFRAFLHRYSEEDDLTLLMVDGNRPRPEFDDVVGNFVNILPLRCQNHCGGSFEELVVEIKTTVEEARQHSDIPFDAIVSALKARQSASHFPLGQVNINYQMYAGNLPKYKTADFEITEIGVEDIPTSADMALEATEDPQGLKLRLEYDNSLYNELEMERFFENFLVFMTSIITDHRQKIDQIEMCGPQELQYLKANCWGIDLKVNVWDHESIANRIIRKARESPGVTAITTSEGRNINYTELIQRSCAFANRLDESYVQPGQLVGILGKPSIELVAAMVGTVFMRCGYVPLDHKFAKGRLSHMVEDSKLSVILVDDELSELATDLANAHSSRLTIITFSSTRSSGTLYHPRLAMRRDPFYVMYTSGSEGKPKGVLINHENGQSALSSHELAHSFTSGDTFLFHSSVAFDLSVAQIWGCLTAGACLALASDVTKQDPAQLAHFIRDANVTITYFPSTQFAIVLEHGREELLACRKYRRAIFAGEYLPIRLVKAIYDLNLKVKVVNQWGPTETTIQTSFHETAYPTDLDLNLPIGFPMTNCSHYVVDSSLNPVPACVIGELCIGGPQVGHGYLNLAHTTEQSFVEDHFAPEPFFLQGWTRMYRTGDKGRFLSDGQIDFRGRVSGDRQIKLRGLRIDLAEIEHEIHSASTAVESHSRVADVAVLLKGPDNHGVDHWTDERRLVAFLVARKDKATTPSEQQVLVDHLHAIIRKSLNDYMLPSWYMFVPALSNLVSSKIDRKWLLSLDSALIHPSSATSASVTTINSTSEVEKTLCSVKEIFHIVLKVPATSDIGNDDSFFDMGGSSLLMLRLRATLKRKLDVDIPLTTLFQTSTPASITKAILDHRNNNEGQAEEIDWEAEATLPDESCYMPSKAATGSRPEIHDILLTGADTPQGVEILASLTKAWPLATFHIVGTHNTLQEADLSASFYMHTGLDWSTSKVHMLESTLVQPNLGLDATAFEDLAKTVQIIYHTGVETSLLKSYQDLKRTNVQGTLNIIKLSGSSSPPIPIHYLSTWSVPHLQKTAGTVLPTSGINFSESPTSFNLSPGSDSGYFRSRFVAEKLLCQAAERGFPVTIYRASALLPAASDQAKTATAGDNFALAMVKATFELGVVPDIAFEEPPFSIDFVPADYIASALARLSLSRTRHPADTDLKAKYFHIGNPAPLRLRDLPAVLREVRQGEGVGRIVSAQEWIGLMGQRMKKTTGDEAQVVLKVLEEYVRIGHSMFSLDDRETKRVLEMEDEEDGLRVGKVECMPMDKEFVRMLLGED